MLFLVVIHIRPCPESSPYVTGKRQHILNQSSLTWKSIIGKLDWLRILKTQTFSKSDRKGQSDSVRLKCKQTFVNSTVW